MAVRFNPQGLANGATAFARTADAFDGHVKSIDELTAALRPAFAGAGEIDWAPIAEDLTTLKSGIETIRDSVTNTSDELRGTANSGALVDHGIANTIGR